MSYSLKPVPEKKIRFCKTFNHPFEPFYDTRSGAVTNIRGYIIFLRCTNCTTERWDTIDYLGELIKREYHYPANYRDYPKGLTKAEQRVLYLSDDKLWRRFYTREVG